MLSPESFWTKSRMSPENLGRASGGVGDVFRIGENMIKE